MATGHKLVKEITDQFLHCKICFEPFKDPKTLSCLHTFCADCLQKHVDSDTNRSSRFLLYSRYITCPLCRGKTEIPSGGIRRLPDNFLLSSLTDVLDRKSGGKSPPCEICPAERSRTKGAASHKCLDCTKLLCKSCVDLHMTTRVTQHHSLIDIEGEKDIECKKHPEEIVRYYCEPCEECVCVVCTFQEHRDHEICSFSDGFSKYRSSLDSLLNQCKDRLGNVQDRLGLINNVEVALKETRENIRDLAISYIAQVRQTERQLVQRVEEDFGSKVQGFLQNKEWLQENMDGLKTTCNLAEIIMNDKGVEMLLLKRELQGKLSTLLEPALPLVPENVSHNIKFVPGPVQLGHIAWNSDEDAVDGDCSNLKHTLNADTDQPRKRQCITQDAETCTTPGLAPIMQEVQFELPPKCFSFETQVINALSQNDLDTLKSNNSTSTTDVSVNTMCSIDDKDASSVCVKCNGEIKDFGSNSSLPVIEGTAPSIQDIIITDGKDRRRRRSFIKSRRVQTDISLSNESLDGVSSQESINGAFRKLSQNSLTAVAECVITASVGLDPIDFGPPEPETPKPILNLPRVFTRTKGVNTTEKVKVVPETRSVRTNTIEASTRHSGTMTTPNSRAVDTQTLDKICESKSVATDYAGQRNKRTSTPIVISVDNSTHMSPVNHENKVTWTDLVQTTERSVSTEMETMECGTEPMPLPMSDKGIIVRPETRTIDTNTDPVQFADSVDASASGAKPKKSKTKDKEKSSTDKEKKEKKTKEKKEKKEKKKYVDSCVETEPVLRSDKETGTNKMESKDSWTSTVTPQMINTGISPDRPATRDAAIATNMVVLVEQGTHTEVVKFQDSGTETILVVCDGETLTERLDQQDAQTSVDLFLQSIETMTDECFVKECGCMTDSEWFWDGEREEHVIVCDICQEKRSVINTGTSPIEGSFAFNNKNPACLESRETQTIRRKLFDKSAATSFEIDDVSDGFQSGTLCYDVSTSTENIPYIGLLSEMDCDELILVPDIAIDMIGSDIEYLKSQNIMPYCAPDMCDSSVQTIISTAILNGEMESDAELSMELLKAFHDNYVTVAVNTDQLLTFEKETCTPSVHQLTQGTNTSLTDKTDKSTTTGSFVRSMQETFNQSPATDRSSKIQKIKRDVSVETDNSLLDEKMIACINKLKTVAERLNSPTTKMFAESMPWGKISDNNNSENENKEQENITEKERKKNVMDLVAKSKAMTQGKEPKTEPMRRKAQPLTTLKAKAADNESQPQKHAMHREGSVQLNVFTSSAPPRSGNQTPTQKRVANVNGAAANNSKTKTNSTPTKIATVASPPTIKRTQKQNGASKMSTTVAKPEVSQTPPATTKQQHQGPEFYSTVPKTRHPKHGLASITINENRNRHSSTGSDTSDVSFRSAASEPASSTSSLDKTLDFSSLKITAPPRAPSVSPTPTRSNGRNSRPTTAPKPSIKITPSKDESNPRMRTGSTSSDQTDNEPSQEKKGFMKKLFGSKKKKSSEKQRNASPSKSPKPGRKALPVAPEKPVEEPSEKLKDKSKPFVYMRSRIFSIEQKDDEKYSKPIVNKYCVNDDEKPPVFDFAATFTKKK